MSAAALVLAGIGRAQFAPRFVKLDGVPAKVGAARANWTQLPNGAWTVRCYSGVLRQDGLRWTVVPPPGPAFVVQLAGLLAELEVLVPSAVALTREQLLFARADEEVAHVVAEAEVLAASTSKTPGTRPGVGEKENEKD
ncbi:MAG: hypothetical protein ACO3DQ_06555 [Cephaloticoccus sp.]